MDKVVKLDIMNLEQKFKEETGFDAYKDNDLEPRIPLGYYVEWLEKQCAIHVVRRSALQWWITLSEIEKADFEFKTFDIIDHKGDCGELTINDITEMFRQHYA
ncbi:MAG: hypothetical protein GY739_00115 [Mesoflavibacter sp.]|nr:hypothetical protein [Mesoflavibacter sp.]